jgi:hypothetical protein
MLAAFACISSSAAAQETTEPVAIEQTQAPATEAAAAAPQVPLGAWVQLEIVEALTSHTATIGQQVALRVAEPVSVDGVVVIPAGTPASVRSSMCSKMAWAACQACSWSRAGISTSMASRSLLKA